MVHPFLSLLASNGGSFLNEEGTASELTSPEALETAELYEKLVADGSSDPRKSTANANTTGPYLDAFVNGQTGMIVMANWWESALRDGMGDDFENVATAPIPVGPSGDESSSISYSWMTMVNGKASDARQEAAWEFLTYLNGPDSGEAGSSAMADILLSMGILPTRFLRPGGARRRAGDAVPVVVRDGSGERDPVPDRSRADRLRPMPCSDSWRHS